MILSGFPSAGTTFTGNSNRCMHRASNTYVACILFRALTAVLLFHFGVWLDHLRIVENLRLYLNSDEIPRAAHPPDSGGKERPLFLGRRFAQGGNRERMFNSGGAGYVLNRAALEVLAENALDNPQCQPHLKGFWEDVQVANCLKKAAGVLPYDTRDELGRERFHPFTPANHLAYRIPRSGKDWYAQYSIDLKEGAECCSARSVSFHYVKHELMPKLHALLYDCRLSSTLPLPRRTNQQAG